MGAYHFARPDNNTPEQEAQKFLNVARDYIGDGFLPPVIGIPLANSRAFCLDLYNSKKFLIKKLSQNRVLLFLYEIR